MVRINTRGLSTCACGPQGTPGLRRGSALVELSLLGAVVGAIVAAVVAGQSQWGVLFDQEEAPPLYAAAVVPDGSRVFLSGSQGAGEVWSLHDGSLWDRLPQMGIMLHAAVYSRDGRSLATTSALGNLHVWHEADGQMHATSLIAHSLGGTAVAFSPDGTLLVSAGIGGEVRVSRARDLALVRTWNAHQHHVRGIAFSPDGTQLLTASRDGTVRLWDLATGSELRSSVVHDGQSAEAVAWSPDGRVFATIGWNGDVRLWSAETAELLHTMTGHTGFGVCLAFSADSRRLASGSWDRTARVWDVETGSCLQTIDGHGWLVRNVALLPQNDQLVTSSWDGAVRVWDWRTKTEVRRFTCRK